MTHNQQSTELQTNEGRSRTRKSLPLQLKNLIHLQTKNVVLNIAGSAILAFGLYNIHARSGGTEGGILGMTLLLQHWLHLDVYKRQGADFNHDAAFLLRHEYPPHCHDAFIV